MLAVVIEAQSLLVFLRDRLMVSFVYQFYIENKVVFQGGWVGEIFYFQLAALICVMTARYRLFFVVDLRLHGVDEMIFRPLNIRDIRDKYTKWTSAVLIAGFL